MPLDAVASLPKGMVALKYIFLKSLFEIGIDDLAKADLILSVLLSSVPSSGFWLMSFSST